jgi:hypothetical protein
MNTFLLFGFFFQKMERKKERKKETGKHTDVTQHAQTDMILQQATTSVDGDMM